MRWSVHVTYPNGKRTTVHMFDSRHEAVKFKRLMGTIATLVKVPYWIRKRMC